VSEEKTNIPGMVIDTATGAVINKELGAYHAIKKAREERRAQAALAERVTALEAEVKYLRNKLEQDNRD
jgi:hypothetical protein